MNRLPPLLGLAVLASIYLGVLSGSFAQSATTSTGNAPPPLLSDGSPTAAINYSDGSSLSVRSKSGRFPLVAVDAAQSVSIQLQFATNTAGNLVVQPLDGGTSPQTTSASVASNGTSTIQFQTGAKPGLYRVLLNQNGAISLLQFWVADPQRPDSGPPVLKPSLGN